jgi:DNA-binding FadR family transcriptional regulator
MSPQLIERRTLADQIAERLRADILAGRRLPGDALPSQRQLAAEFGASTHIVREALRTLQAAGLIEARHGAGVFVAPALAKGAPLDGWDMQTLREARAMLEVGAVEQIIARLDSAGLARLESIVERAGPRAAAGLSVVEDDLEFHRALLELSGNPAVARLAQVIEAFFRKALAGQPAATAGRYPAFVAEHRRLIDALRAGDVRAAQRKLRQHIAAGDAG